MRRKLRIKTTKLWAQGHPESELPGSDSHIQVLPARMQVPRQRGLRAACLQLCPGLRELCHLGAKHWLLGWNGKGSHRGQHRLSRIRTQSIATRSAERRPPAGACPDAHGTTECPGGILFCRRERPQCPLGLRPVPAPENGDQQYRPSHARHQPSTARLPSPASPGNTQVG